MTKRSMVFTLLLSMGVASCGEAPTPDGPAGATGEGRANVSPPAEGVSAVDVTRSAVTAPPPNTWAALAQSVQPIISDAKAISSAYSGVVGAINALTTIGQLLGLIAPPVDEVAQLSAKIDGIATGLTWQIAEQARALDYANMESSIDTIDYLLKTNMPLNVQTSYYQNTVTSVSDSETGIAFQRVFVDSATNGPSLAVTYASGTSTYINTGWKNVISSRPPVTNGLVYDWRLGVPIMLKLIADRLVVMEAVDPNFRTDHNFDLELTQHRNALLTQYQAMKGAITCATQDQGYGPLNYNSYGAFSKTSVLGCNVVCADIYTGAATIATLQPPSKAYGPTNTLVYTSTPCSSASSTTISQTEDSLTWQVNRMESLPTYEARYMADLLYTFLHPAPDLTVQYGQFEPDQSTTRLCADLWGDTTAYPITVMTLAPCNGDDAQFWMYNRETGQIKNPVTNTCMAVLSGSPTSGAYVYSTTCAAASGTPPQVTDVTQEWTYDPELKHIQNPYGLVLQSTLAAGGFLTQTYPVSPTTFFLGPLLYKYQAWHADTPADPFP